ncbi:MAG: cobaltochelatase CobT-related protein [Ilumatobacteraceae bacterium]
MKNDLSFLPPDDPDMDQPSVTGRDFENGTRAAVRTLSSQFDTDVVFAGDGACTNGKRVQLPANAPDKMLTKRQAHVGRGFANHESLHNLLTDFDAGLPRFREWGTTGRTLTLHLAQAIEDVRIENGGAHLYPGMAKSIDKTAEFVCRRFAEKTFKENPEIATDMGAVLPLAITWAGRLRIGYPSPVIRVAFDALGEDVRKRANQVVDVIMTLPHGVEGIGNVNRTEAYKGCRMGLDLADRIGNEVAKQIEDDEQQKRQGQGQGNGQGQGQGQGDGQSQGQGNGDGTPTNGSGSSSQGGDTLGDQQAKGNGDGQSQSERSGSSGSHGATNAQASDATQVTSESRSIDPNLDESVVELMTDGIETSKEYRPYTRSFDVWTSKRSGRLADYMRVNDGARLYAQEKAKVVGSLATMRRKLERALIAKDTRQYEQSRSGKLDVRRRGVGIMSGNDLIFKRKSDGDDLNAAVTILIDLSGSMDGDKVHVAGQSTIALCEAFASTGVPLEVLGHFTHGLPYEMRVQIARELDEFVQDADGNYVIGEDGNRVRNTKTHRYDRTDAVTMTVFKSFDEPMTQARSALGLIPHMTSGANADADAIMYAATRLLEQKNDRRIMLVMADGYPAWHSSGGKKANYRRTRDAVQWAESKGIKCVGIGIQSDAVQQFFPRNVVLQSVDQLGKTVLDQVARLVLGERFRVDNKDLISSDKDRARAMAR